MPGRQRPQLTLTVGIYAPVGAVIVPVIHGVTGVLLKSVNAQFIGQIPGAGKEPVLRRRVGEIQQIVGAVPPFPLGRSSVLAQHQQVFVLQLLKVCCLIADKGRDPQNNLKA